MKIRVERDGVTIFEAESDDCTTVEVGIESHDTSLGNKLRQVTVTACESPPFKPDSTEGSMRIVAAERKRIAAALLPKYLADEVGTAQLCDEVLDRSGNLLGYLRDAAIVANDLGK